MANLSNLPNEILITVLEILATVDLQSLIISQLTNRRFRELGQDAIYNVQRKSAVSHDGDTEDIEINPFWRDKFQGLFNTADSFTPKERGKLSFLTLDGDYTRPFRRLPWAQLENRRVAYLRPEASWRDISLTFGKAPITHLDVVKGYSGSGGDLVDYYQLDLPSSGLTMGLFYDVLLCDKATYRHETGSWELIVGRRLKSYDVLSEYECFIPDDRDLVDKEAHQAAILFVRGGPVRRRPSEVEGQDSWIASSQTKQRLLPWQGPIQNFIFTGYYD
ncbi:uncharacterized protein F4822DRAFT_326206 [Hypoxylon trugodes]|uniref:uncharacterized protein n=1 Tax=Hypoxylon trugodes TaxID=326681 RepID=UPI00219C70F3|nr:uncharacterized protein F4822DRAFT_326206 [Hypoxylon trugodes]KAI1386781.1 hypothetical protein F4822DRAFT_326206 [Hypoxylon trugodes]